MSPPPLPIAPCGYQLERNAKGQITARTETLPDGSTRQYEYGYDARSRLSTVHRDGVLVEAYQYDANGNRSVYTSALRGRHGVSATYNLGDQLQTSGDSSYAYDANGRLAERTTAGVTTRYHYSSLGRLERVETPDKLIEYRHNAIGKESLVLLCLARSFDACLQCDCGPSGAGLMVSTGRGH
ncbi:hypothetical protein HUS23_02115 [Ectothiorhodospiraceae bacterium 2226]|nr:hypothetical protein HUS23_02115 [Ectothiorhodospiraceae bacterium 2226]